MPTQFWLSKFSIVLLNDVSLDEFTHYLIHSTFLPSEMVTTLLLYCILHYRELTILLWKEAFYYFAEYAADLYTSPPWNYPLGVVTFYLSMYYTVHSIHKTRLPIEFYICTTKFSNSYFNIIFEYGLELNAYFLIGNRSWTFKST